MNIYISYILRKYLKSFFIIFLALELFAVGLDLIENLKRIPSANLQLLYALFIMLAFLKYTIPLSLVFAMISSKFQFIKNNELVSMYALGLSRQSVIRPVFFASFLITSLYVFLNLTNASYAIEYAKNIKHNQSLSNHAKNLFLRYNNYYVYMKTLNPVTKTAENIKVFSTKDNDLFQIITAEHAIFDKNLWILDNATILTKPKELILGGKGLETYYHRKRT